MLHNYTFILMCLSGLFLSSCATILNQKHKDVYFYSAQDSTTVSYNKDTISCPGKISIPRSAKNDTAYAHYRDSTDTLILQTIISPVYLWNISSYGIGYAVDLFTKKFRTFSDPIYIDYSKKEISSTWRKPRRKSTILSLQSPLVYSARYGNFSKTYIGAIECEIQHFVTQKSGIYLQGSFFHRKNNHTIIRSEIGFQTIIKQQIGAKIGVFSAYKHSIDNNGTWFWRPPTETEINNSPYAGISLHLKRFLYRELYSFASYSYGIYPYTQEQIHLLEFGYGLSLHSDFIKTKKK
ncbi:MAG: hypothetical protein R6U95_07100 [Bacteroidales bacterium]